MAAPREITLTLPHPARVIVPQVHLVARRDRKELGTVPLGLQPVTVGTAAACGLSFADTRVSREHCSFSLGVHGVRVRDLDSKNGTWIGGARVESALVSEGVEITVGNTVISVHMQDTAPAVVELSVMPKFGDFVGAAPQLRALFRQLQSAAQSDATVLLLGESGTGKELLARGIHDASAKHAGPFVVVDHAGIRPELLEGELFGYQRGAFTGATTDREGLVEAAQGGTLFLDEVGEWPVELQPKLLRLLESREYRPVGAAGHRPLNARVIASTQHDLQALIAAQRFRQDLFFRLAVVSFRVPPLREHLEDIPFLVECWLGDRGLPTGENAPISPRVLAMLGKHSWPGNVRELKNVVERLLLFPTESPFRKVSGHGVTSGPAAPDLPLLPLRDARDRLIEDFEAEYVRRALQEAGGQVTKAADAAGVSRQFFYRLMEKYGLRTSDK
jgi:DNA-binding NtrC family response regulator